MKYVIFTLQEMTPEQLKLNPITAQIEQPIENGEQDIGKENKLLTMNFQVEMEN